MMFSFGRKPSSVYVFKRIEDGDTKTILQISDYNKNYNSSLVENINFLIKDDDKVNGTVFSFISMIKNKFGYIHHLDIHANGKMTFEVNAEVDELKDYIKFTVSELIHREIADELAWLRNYFRDAAKKEYDLADRHSYA